MEPAVTIDKLKTGDVIRYAHDGPTFGVVALITHGDLIDVIMIGDCDESPVGLMVHALTGTARSEVVFVKHDAIPVKQLVAGVGLGVVAEVPLDAA